VNNFIETFYRLGFQNKESLHILAYSEGIILSVSFLKRKMKSLGLFRRKKHCDLLEVASFIMQQHETSFKCQQSPNKAENISRSASPSYICINTTYFSASSSDVDISGRSTQCISTSRLQSTQNMHRR
jgi:hypothetical protein